MKMSRKKLEIPRNKGLYLKFTDEEFEKLCRIAEKKNLSKTETIIQALNLFETYKPKRYRIITDAPKHSIGTEEGPIIPHKPKK